MNRHPLDVRRDPDGRIRAVLTEAISLIEQAPLADERLTNAQVLLDALRMEFGGPPYRPSYRRPHPNSDSGDIDVERLARALHLARLLPDMDEPYCDNPLTEADLADHMRWAEAILHAVSMLPPYARDTPPAGNESSNCNSALPTRCLICRKGPLRAVRRHMRRQHRAILAWDNDYGWTYIHDYRRLR